MEPEKKSSNEALVGLVIIIIILIIGGIYIWMSNQKASREKEVRLNNITAQNSVDLNALEADVKATDVNTGVDASTLN